MVREYRVAPTDLPREKLLRRGAQTLSDQELMMVILGSGCAGRPVEELSVDAMRFLEGLAMEGMPARKIKGLGRAKTCLLLAAREYFRRQIAPRHYRIGGPRQVWELLRSRAGRDQEHLFLITLNGANEVIRIHTVSVGLVNRTVVHPREVFRRAVLDNACSVVVAHNHPSGNLEPSLEDLEVTRRLLEAGLLMGIPLLDHLIIGPEGFVSLHEEGELRRA